MLRISGLHKSFGKNEILKGIDLEVDNGDIIVIMGPSGSGKTTLLRCIEFLERADRGTLEFDELKLDLHKASAKEIAALRRKIGFVFQSYNLFANKTALQNITEGLVVARKMDKKEAEKIGMETLDRVGLSDRYHYYPAELSGGQQQRVGIARATALGPDILLFDEPTSALDPELVGEVLQVMKNLAAAGTTMLVVTHEMSFARQVATKAILMDEGRIVESGVPAELFENPKEARTIQFLKRIRQEETDTEGKREE